MPWKHKIGVVGLLLSGAFAGLNMGTLVAAPGQDDGDGQTAAEVRRAEQLERLARARKAAEVEQAARNVETLRQMQGAWQLVEYVSTALSQHGRQEVAFLVVGGEFMTIELHLAYFDPDGNMGTRIMQTGIYRIGFDEFNSLQATILIGSHDEGDGYSIPHPPGVVKLYKVDALDGKLTLITEDSSRFKFERVGVSALTELLYEEVDWLPGAERREARRLARAIEEGGKAPQDGGDDGNE